MFDGMLNMGEPWLKKMGEKVWRLGGTCRWISVQRTVQNAGSWHRLSRVIGIIVSAVSLTGGFLDVSSSCGIHAMRLDYAIGRDRR